MSKNKKTIAMVTLLTLIFAISLVALPPTNAHTPSWQIPTFAKTYATPDPIGVGQKATISMWLTNLYPSELVTNDYRFRNYQLTITSPNGTVAVKETFDSATPDSFVTYYYTPTEVGTYTINFTFPGQAYNDYAHDPNSGNVNDTFLPSSASATLTVQQEPIPAETGSYPLPTAYWTRPINGQNTAWYEVASNYLESNVAAYQFGAVRYVPGAAAPHSGHIMWTDPIQFGGYTGVNSPDNGTSFFDGRSYEDRFNNPIIISGTLYYSLPVNDLGGGPTVSGLPLPSGGPRANGGYVAVNLRTGQQEWKNYYTVNPSFGIVMSTKNPNQFGALAYLVAVSGSTWIGYDAYTGDWLFNITNVPSGWHGNYGPNGEPEIYTLHVAPTGNWLALWNFTDVITNGNENYLNAWGFHTAGGVFNSTTQLSYSWNVTLQDLPSGSSIKWTIDDNVLLGANIPGSQFGGITARGVTYTLNPQAATFFALSLQSGSIGHLLWEQTYTTPNNITFQLGQVDPTNNVFIMSTKETMQFYGYSLTTGNQIWGPVGNPTPFMYYSTIGQGSSADQGYMAYGNFYVGGYGGIIYAYNDATGAVEWTYGNGGAGNSTNSGLNTPYGNYPSFVGLIADGIVYIYNGNHGNGVPLYKGYTITALNATTGAELWREQAGVEVGLFEDYRIPVADGFITYFNAYDGQVYCIGKGPSATTIQTPLHGISQGDHLVIQGTVMDISAGTKQDQQAGDFPNGVPAVSDASESAWMEYVYMQHPMPANVMGVPVTISALDPNGNIVILGNTTTDSNGVYSIEINTNNLGAGPGLYRVTATFAGSNSYWGSSAESTFVATPASTSAPTSAPASTSMTDQYFVAAVVGIIVAIIIVGAVLALLVTRKRP